MVPWFMMRDQHRVHAFSVDTPAAMLATSDFERCANQSCSVWLGRSIYSYVIRPSNLIEEPAFPHPFRNSRRSKEYHQHCIEQNIFEFWRRQRMLSGSHGIRYPGRAVAQMYLMPAVSETAERCVWRTRIPSENHMTRRDNVVDDLTLRRAGAG